MAKVGNFNSSKHEDSGFPVAPIGRYKAVLVKDERKKAGSGNEYLNQQFKVTRGKHKGVRFFNILNLWNDNAQAAQIANAELASLTRAVFGEDRKIKDTKVMYNKEFDVQLGIEKDNKGKDKNVILSYGGGEAEHDEPDESKSKNKKKKNKGKKKPNW